MKTNSNTYTIIYSVVLVVIVAFLLAFVSMSLKEKQEANVALDQKKQILYSLNIRGLNDAQAEKTFNEVVKGKDVDYQSDANDMRPLITPDPMDGKDGIYYCEVDGQQIKVLSLKGMGLWGGISGYLAIKGNSVYGAYFNHESETAGLGAEIKDNQKWQELFHNKKVYDEKTGTFILSVVKTVKHPASEVDAVTGATLTSNGVNDMIHAGLKKYIKLSTKFEAPMSQKSK